MSLKTLLLMISMGLMVSCANGSKKSSTTTTTAATETKSDVSQKKDSQKADIKAVSVDIFVCSRESDVREIYIELVTPLGCKLWYSNHKTGSPIAQSVKGLKYCETVSQNIRSNLETAGFKCNAVNSKSAAKL